MGDRGDPLNLVDSVPGFGRCHGCPYVETGQPSTCWSCAATTFTAVAPLGQRCRICAHPYPDDSTECGNPVCKMGTRCFEWSLPVAMREGRLKDAISDFKYNDHRYYAPVFGRILLGHLDANRDSYATIGLIVASPTFTGAGATRSWDHTRAVLLAAASQQGDTDWPFDTAEVPAVIKAAETPRMVGMGYLERRRNAEGPLRESLRVPDSNRVHNLDVLVYDDVMTDGLTLREVARALRGAGASKVYGLSLARQQYRGAKRADAGEVQPIEMLTLFDDNP